jgi:hypothetical protein
VHPLQWTIAPESAHHESCSSVNQFFSRFHARAGGTIALWKSVGITVKVQIGGAAAQIELREVADKRRLYLVAKAVF